MKMDPGQQTRHFEQSLLALLVEASRQATRSGAISRRGRGLLVAGVAAAVFAASVVLAIIIPLMSPTPLAAGIDVRREGEWFVIEVTDPERDSAELSAALQARGVNVRLATAPVSPSLVGTITGVSADGYPDPTRFSPLQSGPCLPAIEACRVGFRIRTDYSDSLWVTLGRAAQAGESYSEGSVSIWSPGEALECRDLYGAAVTDAVEILLAQGIDAVFRGMPENAAMSDLYVLDILPLDAGVAAVFVVPEPPPSRVIPGSVDSVQAC